MDADDDAPLAVRIPKGFNRSTTMDAERKPQDQPQDEVKDDVKKAEESSKELTEEQLNDVAGGAVNAFLTFYDKADGESLHR